MASTVDRDLSPKRVAGGIVVRAKNKRMKAKDGVARAPSSVMSSTSSSLQRVPAILSSVPPPPPPRDVVGGGSSKSPSIRRDEFDDCAAAASSSLSFGDLPSDALMCLRAYTSPPAMKGGGEIGGLGAMSETCAYCPIFSSSDDGDTNDIVCGAAPFLTRGVLLNALVGVGSSSSSSSEGYHNKDNDDEYERKRVHAELEVRRLLVSDIVRPLRLHGLGAGFDDDDDDDDDDVAIMETSVFVDASGMALDCGAARSSPLSFPSKKSQQMATVMPWEVHAWFTQVILPRFAGRTWATSRELEGSNDKDTSSHSVARDADGREGRESTTRTDGPRCRYSATQRSVMIQQLTRAGLLLPKRHVEPGREDYQGRDSDQYWFSLPGLGRAAWSIERGRANVLRRLRSCPNGEKGRTALERDIERSIVARRAWRCDAGGDDDGVTRRGREMRYHQSGKFVVMDLLAKGWIRIHVTCTGEQLVRLAE